MGDGSPVPILALGVIKLFIESCNVILSECHYYLKFMLNIISIGQLAIDGYELLIKSDIFNIIVNGVGVKFGQLQNGIYLLSRPVSIVYM